MNERYQSGISLFQDAIDRGIGRLTKNALHMSRILDGRNLASMSSLTNKLIDFPSPPPLLGIARAFETNLSMLPPLTDKLIDFPSPPLFHGLELPQPGFQWQTPNVASTSGIHLDCLDYDREDARALVLFALDEEGLRMAPSEFRRAYLYLNTLVEPDLTGAITHVAGGLESLARFVARDNKSPLYRLIRKRPDLFPWPVRQSIEAVIGYSSQYGRHVSEDKVPSYSDTEYLVNSATSAALFLIRQAGVGGHGHLP